MCRFMSDFTTAANIPHRLVKVLLFVSSPTFILSLLPPVPPLTPSLTPPSLLPNLPPLTSHLPPPILMPHCIDQGRTFPATLSKIPPTIDISKKFSIVLAGFQPPKKQVATTKDAWLRSLYTCCYLLKNVIPEYVYVDVCKYIWTAREKYIYRYIDI